jgi:hypothetical protein
VASYTFRKKRYSMAMTIKHKIYADGTESGILHPENLLGSNEAPTPSPGKRIDAEILIRDC